MKEVRGWELTRSADILKTAIQTLADQEEGIRIAEASPLGFKLLEAYKDKSVGFRFVADKEKAVELKKLEQELLKEKKDGEISRKVQPAASRFSRRSRSRSRSKSRRRERSRSVERRRTNLSAKKNFGKDDICFWCGKLGHSFKQCIMFNKDSAEGKVGFDTATRKFYRKDRSTFYKNGGEDQKDSRRRSRSGSRSRGTRRK